MKRLSMVLISLGFAAGAAAQDWGWGEPAGGSSGSGSGTTKSGSGSSSSGSGTVGASSSGGAGTTSTTPAGPVTPTIGTHYDDPAVAHFEPGHTHDKPNVNESEVVPYPYLREADVKFKRRIWRRIDTRQKLNKSFTWPGMPVTEVLYELAVEGKVKAYKNDSLTSYFTPEEAYQQGADFITTTKPDWRFPDDPDAFIDTQFWDQFKWEKIIKFEIMEDWIFDYKHSEMKPRIIAIAPLREFKAPNGLSFEVPLFWLKMDDCRPTLAKCEVYNRYNDAMRISWDDLFNHYRLFDSYIVKQTDWDNRYINQKPEFQNDGLAALLEGENIKNDLFIFEHDLWEF